MMGPYESVYPVVNEPDASGRWTDRGIGSRDHIAIEAMKALIISAGQPPASIAEAEAVLDGLIGEPTTLRVRTVCKTAYVYADAMIEASLQKN